MFLDERRRKPRDGDSLRQPTPGVRTFERCATLLTPF